MPLDCFSVDKYEVFNFNSKLISLIITIFTQNLHPINKTTRAGPPYGGDKN